MASGQIDRAAVEAAVADFKDPESGRSALKFEQIRDIKVDDGRVSMTLALTTWAGPIREDVRESLIQLIKTKLPDASSVAVDLDVQDRPPQKLGEIGLTAKTVIAVGSGKGGVGKSTIASSLALGLKRAGCKVGLMDADVYGPSIPHLLGVQGQPAVENNKIQPIVKDGLPIMSIGFFVPPEQAVVWRGPMLHQSVTQFLRDVAWGELDYLIIDMPPGTGDVALSLSQLLPLSGAVVVCTPQDVALLDAVKAIAMFRQVNIPILGMVENMSGFVCPDCGKRYDIFGSGGARERAEQLQVPFLGDVPINIQIREHGDQGQSDLNFEDTAVSSSLSSICHSLVSHLANKSAAAPPQPQLPVLG